jgi:hypothetical protein
MRIENYWIRLVFCWPSISTSFTIVLEMVNSCRSYVPIRYFDDVFDITE